MKTIFRLLCGWMAIALAACTGDELQQIEPLQKPVAQKTISVKAYTPSEQAATRLAFEDKKAEGLKLSWTADDAFTAVIGGEKVTFTYNESSKEFTANVNESVTLTDGLKAYYPAYDGENFEMDFSRQTGQLNGATTYMEGVYEGDAFKFTHSTAILKAKFSDLPQNAVISSIQISGAVDITISNATISKDSIYINLPSIPKDGQLKFMVETATGNVYTATKTVRAVEGIKTGVYYNTTVELQEACLLPMGIDFYSAISAVDIYGNATSIVFEANVADETPATRSDSNYTIALADNVLTISTPLSEFVFNEDCNSMFASLPTITAIDFNNCINTSKVVVMDYMFSGCIALTSLDLSSFNTANVMSMTYMFYDCQKLTSLNLSSFNTANGTNMAYMFDGCIALTSLDLSSFNTSNVTDMDYMFNNCFSLTSLNVSNFNTSNVTKMSYMFNNCSSLTSLDLSSFDFGKDANFSGMFTGLGGSAGKRPIPVYVTMAGYNVLSKKSIGINNSSAQLVALCELLTGSSFNSAVNSFLNGKSLTKIKFVANSDAATTKSDANGENATEDYSYRLVADSDNETLEIHTAVPKFVFNADCFGMFASLFAITAIDFNNCINTANVTNMGYMFYGCSALESLDLSSFNTANVTNMAFMFSGCQKLTSLNVSSFNTANVTNMASMFSGCQKLTSLNVSSFNTANVILMNGMFNHCKTLTSLDLSSFNTANVEDMVNMFNFCSSLTSLDLSSFNTANVILMNDMFNSCSALTSLDLSNFNTANVMSMANMFHNCSSLTSLDLSSFDFKENVILTGMFDYLGLNATNKPIPVYVKDVNDKQKLDNANTGINSSFAEIKVKQP